MGTIKERDLSFVFSLLNEHWTRIRSLYMYIDCDVSKSNCPWHRLGQPNQYLEFFDVYFRGCPPQSLSAPRFLLFSDRAPSLLKFHHHNLHFTLQAAWLCHIRLLKMEDLTAPFTASELIEAFTRMPLLEVLDVYIPESPLENNPNLLPYPNLPRLTEFRLSGALSACLTILEHITPAPGCAVFMTSRNYEVYGNIPGIELANMRRILFQCAEYHFDNYCTTEILVELREMLSFSRVGHSMQYKTRFPHYVPIEFDLSIICSPGVPPPFIPVFLDSLPLHKFANIATLTLDVPTVRGFQPSNPIFIQFLLSFNAVEVLKTSPKTLKFLSEVPKDTPLFFPLLRTIKIVDMANIQRRYNELHIMPFLILREAAGIPIEVFDLTKWVCPGMGNFGYLEDMTGLKVVWRVWLDKNGEKSEVREYVCGSGMPQRLAL
ncbi:hypothetical protein BDZ97DRAFT_1846872 [Flammula alnicola]|nr:hypothetical protein BDZ97DRAFT_1846872 [Flammula alnicola]